MPDALTTVKKQRYYLELLKGIAEEKQLDQTGFYQLDALLTVLGSEVRNRRISRQEIAYVNTIFGMDFLKETLQGRGLLKPCGYSGDYLILDRIYTYYTSDDPKYRLWDAYFQQQVAMRAIRHRKTYFQDLVMARVAENRNLRILNVISGSGRELMELYRELPPGHNVNTTCVEMDDDAIAYSKGLNANYLRKIKYVHTNIFSYNNPVGQDLIWAAGLLDRSSDEEVVSALELFKNWLNPGGEIVLGNFNAKHYPSRDYMELLCEWELNCRTEGKLTELAGKAGFGFDQIRIGAEKENLIQFLHLKVKSDA
ncbi:class I SAM-dependent methyltransferase [Poritiphilus flavus]|uniref:Methyltransferase domain-containing protein n=1 Tax=Poritiphilus flavus TaxID=2697053 RepID=A0A6L9E850_9FLAO|nr:class I SAM-dependent methyltransferase [Poritiphilus flavus]NAS10824.1 hypothetical protein [Poritiphilus flavus]